MKLESWPHQTLCLQYRQIKSKKTSILLQMKGFSVTIHWKPDWKPLSKKPCFDINKNS